MINDNFDIFISEDILISETKLDETFPTAQFFFFKVFFAIPIDLIVIATVMVLCSISERIYLYK